MEIEEGGWVNIHELMKTLKKKIKWMDLEENDLYSMIESSNKKRCEIVNNKIRALYGHSIKININRESVKPPQFLFHGTARSFINSIKNNGLLPQDRQYVHLSEDRDTAHHVGIRKDEKPIILKLNAKKAWRNGVSFYKVNDKVWLSGILKSN